MPIGRRALLGAAGAALVVSQHSIDAAWAAEAPSKKKADITNSLFKLAFEQSEKLAFGERGWGDAEAKLLSTALTRSSAVRKLFLNDNAIQDAGVAALSESLRAGAAPKLKMINLAGNSGVSEEAARVLAEAREGLMVSFQQPAFQQPATKKAGSEASSASKRPSRDFSQGSDVNAVYKLAFEQAETLFFSELDLGDAEAEALSQELYAAVKLKKLFLNGNAIQCDGSAALAASLRAGDAPMLKLLNLAGNRGITESDKRVLTSARSGLSVNFVQYKQASDADVYIRADQGKLTVKGVIERYEKGQLVDGSSATCTELKKIVEIDLATLKIENKLLPYMKDPEQIKLVEGVIQALETQVERLVQLLDAKATKGCKDDNARIRSSSGFPLPTEVFEDKRR